MEHVVEIDLDLDLDLDNSNLDSVEIKYFTRQFHLTIHLKQYNHKFQVHLMFLISLKMHLNWKKVTFSLDNESDFYEIETDSDEERISDIPSDEL